MHAADAQAPALSRAVDLPTATIDDRRLTARVSLPGAAERQESSSAFLTAKEGGHVERRAPVEIALPVSGHVGPT